MDEQLLHMLDKRMTLAREIGALETPEQVVFVERGALADIVKSRLDWASQMG